MLTDNQMKALCEMLGYFPAFAEEKEAFNRLTADATKKQAGFLEHVKTRFKDLAGDPERRAIETKLTSYICVMGEKQFIYCKGFLEGCEAAEKRCKNAER